jgi:hypothetical protein
MESLAPFLIMSVGDVCGCTHVDMGEAQECCDYIVCVCVCRSNCYVVVMGKGLF